MPCVQVAGDGSLEMKGLKSEGVCTYCKKSFTGNAMAKHLAACAGRKQANNKGGNDKIFLIKAGLGPFWVYFEVNACDSLTKVDNFLRDLWLECCGHLSAFKISYVSYASSPDSEYGDKSMKVALDRAIAPGMAFLHEYDFGTTTTLGLRCLAERGGEKLKKVEIIARNNLPDFKCKCGNEAKDVCSECVWESEEKALLCSQCAKKHKCGEEMLLPVVNSPRMGMCGYTGGGME